MPFIHYGRKYPQSSGSTTTLTPTHFYDPNNTNSFSGSGDTTITNIGSVGDVSGTQGTLSGVTYVQNSGLDFDGGSDRITFSSYDFGNVMTVSAWVYPRAEYSINTVMANASANLNTNGFKLEWNNWNTSDLKMLLEAGNGSQGNVLQSVNPVVVLEEWQQLIWVIDFDNTTAQFYRNAVSVPTTGSIVSNVNTNAAWNIGSMMGAYYMDATLGQLKVFDFLLSSEEVQTEFDETKSLFGL